MRAAEIRSLRRCLATTLAVLTVWGTLATMGYSYPDRAFPTVDELPSIKEMPDPLVKADGRKVETIEHWNSERRPELIAQFQHYMYGVPAAAPKITATVMEVDRDVVDGAATMKQVTIDLGPPNCPKINLILFVPNQHAGDHPPAVFLGANFTGNHTILTDKRIALANGWMPEGPGVHEHQATDAGRGSAATVWPIAQIMRRGYAVATFYYGDVTPDKPGLNAGVFPYFRPVEKTAQDAAAPTDWASIAAWAWGLQRAVDYLVTDQDVDSHRIIVFGHSRLGKTALLAGALDPRIAATIAHQAGCGGSAPDRRKNPKSEPVTRINTNFPHWFDGVFKQFNGREDRLPFDQNGLVALCAPRPVLFSCGEQDVWADPPGELDVLRAAGSVYRLFGLEGIPEGAEPESGKLFGTSLCYYIRNAPHIVNSDYWNVFMEFADKAVPAKK